MTLELINLLFLCIALAQALFAVTYVLVLKKKTETTMFFVLFLVAFISPTIDHIISSSDLIEKHPRFFYTPMGFYFLLIPFFYLYVKSSIQELNTKETLILLIPGLLEFIFMSVMFCLPESYTTNFRMANSTFFISVYGVTLPIFAIILLSLSVHRIFIYRKKYLNFFSNTQKVNLKWLRYTSWLLILSYSFQLLTLFSFLNYETRDLIFLLDSVLSLVFLYWITLYGIKQSHIPAEFQIFERSKVSTLSNEGDFTKIKEVLITTKAFKNPNLTVVELAESVDLHPKKVSSAINTFSTKNFNQFINQYRIEEAKKLLLDPAYNTITIEALAKESGFNSKSVFNTLFKAETGQTPTSFKDLQLT